MSARLTKARVAQLCEAIVAGRADAIRRHGSEWGHDGTLTRMVTAERELLYLVGELAGAPAMVALNEALDRAILPEDLATSHRRAAENKARCDAYDAACSTSTPATPATPATP